MGYCMLGCIQLEPAFVLISDVPATISPCPGIGKDVVISYLDCSLRTRQNFARILQTGSSGSGQASSIWISAKRVQRVAR